MILARRRYYIWLLNAYLGKWKNTILLFLLLGGVSFFILLKLFETRIPPLLQKEIVKTGYFGSFTLSSLPDELLEKISYGLTIQNKNGEVRAGAAQQWEIKDNGKVYVVRLKKGQYSHNREELTSFNLKLDFKDVRRKNLDKYTVMYELKEPYSPFLTTLSKPIFLKGVSGLGEYKLTHLELNANFVKSVTIQSTKAPHAKEIFYFYPTERALKIAFALGEIDKAVGLSDLAFDDIKLTQWKNTRVEKRIRYNTEVVLFYNTADKELSNKKIRQALNYALPPQFEFGERAYTPISPVSIYYNRPLQYESSNIELAKSLLPSDKKEKEAIKLQISTTKNYEAVARIAATSWRKLGLETSVKLVDDIPPDFQILIRSFKLPPDPDQYTIWHSDQRNNISHYKNLRIDKLLEDGRVSERVNERVKIYSDFQKYLLDDVPASFLYYPYEYAITRL